MGRQHVRLLHRGPADLLPARRIVGPGRRRRRPGRGGAGAPGAGHPGEAALPVGEDSTLLPSLLTLSDVFPTGHHCAVKAGVNPRTTVTVIGDGAVVLSA